MEREIHFLEQTRRNLLAATAGLSIEQLNKIPEGYSNNVVWNVAHCLVTQQLLHYKLAGEQPYISSELIDLYRKGTKPTKTVSVEEWESIKEMLMEMPQKLKADLEAGMFKGYTEYTTSFKVTLFNIEEAIRFNLVHEGLHLGYVMAMRKLL